MKKFYLLTFLIVFQLRAQQESYLSLLNYQMPLVNPAYAGAEVDHLFSIHSRNQWANIENSPRTLSMVYSVANSKNVGLGISVIADELFIEKQTLVSLDFSYKLKLNDQAHLFLGLKGNINSFRADTSELIAHASEVDPSQKDLSRLMPNFGVGFLFKHDKYWIAASSPKLFKSKRDAEINLLAQDRLHYYLSGGTQFKINDEIALEPQFLIRGTRGLNSVVEGILWGNYRDKFRLGIGLRTAAVRSFKFNFNLNKTLALAYAYDVYANGALAGMQLNAHEIGLRISLTSKKEGDTLKEIPVDPEYTEKWVPDK